MDIQIRQKDTTQIQKSPVLQQTAFWAEVKKKLGEYALAFHLKVKENIMNPSNTGKHVFEDDILVTIKFIDNEHSIAYIPYGPKMEPGDELQGEFLEELSESLRYFLPKHCIMIRYDLPWESQWAHEDNFFDKHNNWIGPPAKRNQEFRLNFNTNKWNLVKANSDILPSNTIFIDLKKDKNELLKKMKPKTRYNIRLSQRKGLSVRNVGLENIDIWYSLYKETASRNHIFLDDIDYFKTMLNTTSNNSLSPAEIKLLIAELNGKPLAAMFLAISGRRGTYLFGASSSVNRKCMATYALQWQAINIAKLKGCTEYDMFGVSPNPNPAHPMYGLFRFKSGFGGRLYHRMGCWDYPLQEKSYEIYKASEMSSQGYHIN